MPGAGVVRRQRESKLTAEAATVSRGKRSYCNCRLLMTREVRDPIMMLHNADVYRNAYSSKRLTPAEAEEEAPTTQQIGIKWAATTTRMGASFNRDSSGRGSGYSLQQNREAAARDRGALCSQNVD